MEDPPADQ